jgi:2-dehydro-3-deoxyphosphogluconate aldolase/(4S)-4-hydroxy-2-oxoglutarate aldolase
MRKEIIQRVMDHKIVAIVRGVYGEDCLNLAKALCEGGIKLLEVTFDQLNTEKWQETADTISLLKENLGDKMCFGAGTVTSVELVNIAKQAGADFIVSPDINKDVIKATVKSGMVSMPGAMTPTEVLHAHSLGADFVKLFPAGSLGAGYIKAISAPINHVKILAVGGVDENNAAEFIAAGAVGVGAGGKLVNKKWIAEGKFDEISALAKKFSEGVKENG